MQFRTSCAAALWACLLAFTYPVHANDDPGHALGTYEKKGNYWQQVKITSGRATGRFHASFEVATRGCIGEAAMDGIRSGPNRFVFSTLTDGPKGKEMCKIDITSQEKFQTIKIAHEYCFGFYGTACDFNGTLKRTRR